ncbi:EF-hand domain-containing protein [Antarctobacter jejuensis]|uniref:EF-hand domain-containing protein n=1 Tax=Antarctobacter jejuensis TaxID=1439938 RepID=UPI003FCFB428
MTKYLALALALTAAPAFAQRGNPGAHFVENWDLDGDGAVTVAEATERRGDVFSSFDANDDGFLDAQEYVLFDEAREEDMKNNAVGHGGGLGRGGMMRAADGMLLVHNDADGDGKVSREEFTTNAAAWIAQMDRTGDGVVTTDDFGRGRGQGMGLGQAKSGN